MNRLEYEVIDSEMKPGKMKSFTFDEKYLSYIADSNELKSKQKDLVSIVALMKQLTEVTEKETQFNMFYSINKSNEENERVPSYALAIPSIGNYDRSSYPKLNGDENPTPHFENENEIQPFPFMIPLVNLHTHPVNSAAPSYPDLVSSVQKSFNKYESVFNQRYLMKGSPINIIISTGKDKELNELVAYRFVGFEQLLDADNELSKINSEYGLWTDTFDERIEVIRKSPIFNIKTCKYKNPSELRKKLPKLLSEFAPFELYVEKIKDE